MLELHNVQQYLEHGFLPNAYTEDERERAKARIPQIRSAVARYFSAIDNTNFAAKVAGVGHEYHGDLRRCVASQTRIMDVRCTSDMGPRISYLWRDGACHTV
jgi:hypothetical protein